MSWLELLAEAATHREPSVLVMVAAVKGSAPREPGAALLVTPKRVLGTVGGGRLEFLAIETARELLAGKAPGWQQLARYDLVPSREQDPQKDCDTTQRLGQCCGGVVQLQFECFGAELPEWVGQAIEVSQQGESALLASYAGEGRIQHRVLHRQQLEGAESLQPALQEVRSQLLRMLAQGSTDAALLFPNGGGAFQQSTGQPHVLVRLLTGDDFVPVIFGAGHVGRALVQVLAPLVRRLLWCDSRSSEFPEQVPGRVEVTTEDPLKLIARAPAGAYFIVMTHSHPLDLSLCEAILRRGRFNYLGLIGSRVKRARFEQALRKRGIADDDLARMISPIGVPGIRDKQPAAIAIAVAAQLLQVHELGCRQ